MMHYIDCGAGFISAGNHSVNSTLLPEELHPNTEGYRVLAACLKPVVDALVLGKALSSLLDCHPAPEFLYLIDMHAHYRTSSK